MTVTGTGESRAREATRPAAGDGASPPRPRGRRRFVVRALLAGLLLVVLCAIDAFLVEPNWIEVTEHRVALDRAPRMRIVHLTDLHMSAVAGRERRAIALAAGARPDLIVVTGDLVDTGGAYDAVEEFLAALAALGAPQGVIVIRGNWEHWSSSGAEPIRWPAGRRPGATSIAPSS